MRVVPSNFCSDQFGLEKHSLIFSFVLEIAAGILIRKENSVGKRNFYLWGKLTCWEVARYNLQVIPLSDGDFDGGPPPAFPVGDHGDLFGEKTISDSVGFWQNTVVVSI